MSSNQCISARNSELYSGGTRISHWEGVGPPTRALFGENVCKNERIMSRRGGGVRRKFFLDLPLLYVVADS